MRVERLGLLGDSIVDARRHGGPNQAVYAYAREDAAWRAAELARPLAPGNFGENLSTEGVDLTNAVIGEQWTIGSCLLQVNCFRIPCRVFAGFWQVPNLVKRFTARGKPGVYLRVLREGDVGAGDSIEIVHRPEHGVTVRLAYGALMLGESELIPCLVDVPEFCDKAKEAIRRRLADVPA